MSLPEPPYNPPDKAIDDIDGALVFWVCVAIVIIALVG